MTTASKAEPQPARWSQTTPYSEQPGIQNPSPHSVAVLENENNMGSQDESLRKLQSSTGNGKSFNPKIYLLIFLKHELKSVNTNGNQ